MCIKGKNADFTSKCEFPTLINLKLKIVENPREWFLKCIFGRIMSPERKRDLTKFTNTGILEHKNSTEAIPNFEIRGYRFDRNLPHVEAIAADIQKSRLLTFKNRDC